MAVLCPAPARAAVESSEMGATRSSKLTPPPPPPLPPPPSPSLSTDIKMDKSSRSKGWGIVKFSTLEEAHAAIAGMNGSDCEGRPMEVRLDRGAVTREEVEGGAY